MPRKFSISIFIIVLLIMSCSSQEQVFKKSTILMDTFVTITVVSNSAEKAEKAINGAFNEIKSLEMLMSFWSEESEIAAIYENAEIKPVKVSKETLNLIEKALYVSKKTGGAFDPTIGPVIRLWDFKKKIRPDEKSLKLTLPLVNYKMMRLNKRDSTAFLQKKGMSFDTGGILKGYAADKAVESLKKSGIRAGLVAIAGDIRAFGRRPDGTGWKIGIRDPEVQDKVIATVELLNEAISTSGDYERFFVEKGVKYHHLLDPKTGMPATGFKSVSIIAKEGAMTDGFSTGVFIMGPEKGLKLVKDMGFNAVTVDGMGNIRITDGIKNRVARVSGLNSN